MGWFIYMVRCADSSFYTGITKDVERRVSEHNSPVNGAKYTRHRRPVSLIYTEESETRSSATKRELEIKKLSRTEKAALALSTK